MTTVQPLVVLCNCEHIDHFEGRGHEYMAVEAGSYTAMFVGRICDDCALGHMRTMVLMVEPGSGPQLTIVYIEARAWIADCEWADLMADDVDQLTWQDIKRGVQKHYEGGWDALVLACHDLMKPEPTHASLKD